MERVTINVKGTDRNTTSNAAGNFQIEVNKKNDTLVLTSVGFEVQEIPLSGRTIINATMLESFSKLNDVVVIGFGTQERGSLTTAISKLDNSVLENVPFSNAANALEGTIPGLRVQSTSGQPGARPRIILRGGTSINNPNGATPLYVIDGVITDNMDGVNPNEIESVQVLKDAASTSIYGARSSNGVIIITTKSGKTGRHQINYNYDITVSKVGKLYDLLMGKDYVYFARTGIANTASITPSFATLLTGSTYAGGTGNDLTNRTYLSLQYLTPENEYKLNEGWESMPDPLDPSKTLIFSNTDYQSRLFQTGISHHHSLSVSGGNDEANYRLGVGYQTNEGIAIHSSYQRLDLNFSGDLKVNDRITVFSKIRFNTVADRMLDDIYTRFQSSMIEPPTQKLYLEDGTLSPGRSSAYVNPEYILATTEPKNQINDITMLFGSRIKLFKNLSFEPSLSYSYTDDYSRNFTQARWEGVAVFNATRPASGAFSRIESPQANAVLTYSKLLYGVHNLNVKAGFSYYGLNNSSIGATGSGAATDLIPTLDGSATPESVSGAESHQKLMGYFSRVLYDFKGKYLFNASVRYDGASNLGSDHKWGVFPAVSVGWNADKEEFWRNVVPDNLIRFKLRGSYGLTGNISGLGLYQSQGVYNTTQRYGGNAAVMIQELPNPDLKWEQSRTLDIGTDIGLFDGRVSFMFDYFRRVTDNLLTNLSLPPSSGFLSVLTNLGSLENKGVEVDLGADILRSDSKLKWRMSLNFATVHSKILKLPPNGQKNNRIGGIYVYDPGTGEYGYKGGLQEGGRIGDLYGYKQLNIYPTDEDAAKGPVDMLIPQDRWPKLGGDVNWLDVDNNDTIDTRDQIYMGNPFPTLTGGFSTSLSYGGLELEVRMDYSVGATIYFETGARLEGNFSGSNALSKDILRSWQKPGDITDIPRYYWADQNAHWNVWDGRGNSRFFQKADFLALREITIAYNFRKEALKKIGISDLRVHITGNNLYYFTGFGGLNPEETSTDVAYPVPRILDLGVSIMF